MTAENWACISDYSNGVEISKFDTALLMSLLEESNGEEYNDEQVNKVIQSLEAEIYYEQHMLESQDLAMEPELLLSDKEDGQNYLASTEFDMEQLPCSPSYDMNWSNMDQCGGLDLDEFVEYEFVSDGYSQIYNIVSDTDQEHGFSSLWHETCDAVSEYN
ncbi:hypothetical protein KPL70_007187 [Citrus sinensis]|uniref:Uncharacterized protein n=1 Tax=Citrus clementina TaxID=85681 RepID=V4TQ21_CITCL|nr:hypothetical protein CICLE_v10022628mg [Citrus x clementina]KAH9723665.1 hypothetical protein KPL70_007187 [Citrus sinensis]